MCTEPQNAAKREKASKSAADVRKGINEIRYALRGETPEEAGDLSDAVAAMHMDNIGRQNSTIMDAVGEEHDHFEEEASEGAERAKRRHHKPPALASNSPFFLTNHLNSIPR